MRSDHIASYPATAKQGEVGAIGWRVKEACPCGFLQLHGLAAAGGQSCSTIYMATDKNL